MIRALLTAAAALLLLGAARPATVAYRLGIEPGQPATLEVEMRLRGDADGETRIDMPPAASEPTISGARLQASEARQRLLLHRPGAKLRVRYRLRAPAASAEGIAVLGEAVFATPAGRSGESATFRWAKRPRAWRFASDLEHGAPGPPMTVAAVVQSVVLAGPDLQAAEQPIAGGVLRAATPGDAAGAQAALAAAAPLVSAHRAFWGEETGPFLVAVGPFGELPVGRGDAVAMRPDADFREALAAGLARDRIPGRPAATPAGWLVDGFPEFFAERLRLRAGATTVDEAAGRLAALDQRRDPASRGALLALKWDEEIRRKTGGKADLDDVILRMRDHYQQFPPGQGPDVVTGLVSAAWVVAKLDLRPDIARYVDGGAAIPLPETLFDGCLDARVTVSPAFDSGFDHEASAASKVVKGVRRLGPAWNSGLRDGMRIDAIDLKAGDMTREIVLTVRPARGTARPRQLRYWPYGDNDVEARRLELAMGLSGDALAACGRKLGGL